MLYWIYEVGFVLGLKLRIFDHYFDSNFRYAIGGVFENEDCETCTCSSGGLVHCVPKKCPPCTQVNIQFLRNIQCSDIEILSQFVIINFLFLA